MRVSALFCLLGFVLFSVPARADEETCAACDHAVQVDGEFRHYKSAPDLQIVGAAPNDMAAFREQIEGKNFTVAVLHLSPGQYTVMIGEAETYYSQPGQRSFNISVDDAVLADGLDIVAAAGAPNKVFTLTGQVVVHTNDAMEPLKIAFTGVNGNAKFNTLVIQNENGAEVVSMNAADLADP